MCHELDEEILTNKLQNMNLNELFSFDAVKAVQQILGQTIDLEAGNPLLTTILNIQCNCFKEHYENISK